MNKNLILLSLIVAFFFPSKGQAQSVYPVYIVQSGDSLGGIASKFDLPLADLLSINNLIDPDSIYPGQELQIPGFGNSPGVLSFQPIGLFENLDDLVIKNNLNKDWLIMNNQLVSPTEIYSGSELLVLKSKEKFSNIFLGKVTGQVSLLEESVLSKNNPYSLLLLNNWQSSSRLLEGQSVYSHPNRADQNPQSDTQIKISPLPLVQGATEEITVDGNNIKNVSGTLNGHDLQFSKSDDGAYFALQGIHAMANPGLTQLSILIEESNGNISNYHDDILLQPGTFDFEELTVAPELIDPMVTKPENEFVEKLVTSYTPTKFWEGKFQSPAVYQYYNSLFGTRRRYNGNPEVTFHAGLDFGGGITLPIFAPAAGKVVFAGPLNVRGNTVFIDHGLGIYSGFFHQNNLLVKTGDIVNIGQQIGEVGNTGRIDGTDSYYGAGAHLHWEIWVNGVQVDPLTWLSTEFP